MVGNHIFCPSKHALLDLVKVNRVDVFIALIGSYVVVITIESIRCFRNLHYRRVLEFSFVQISANNPSSNRQPTTQIQQTNTSRLLDVSMHQYSRP